MAEFVLVSILPKLLGYLGQSGFQEVSSCWGVKGELKKFELTLRLIKDLVADAEKRQEGEDSAVIKKRLCRLRALLYRADDLYNDLFIAQQRKQRTKGDMVMKIRMLLSSSNPLLLNMKVAREFRSIRQDLNDIKSDGENVIRERNHGERIGETANDDELFSSTTDSEPVSSISLNGVCKIDITQWEKGRELGRGSFGTVYEGISGEGFFFAVKEVPLPEQGSQGRQIIEQEIKLLSQFQHKNIVRYLGTEKVDSTLYIFLELVTQGSLAKVYQNYNLSDSQVSAYTRQILLGLNYLHDRNVIHRDIKCANILVASDGTVKLADFGLAKVRLNDWNSSKGSAYWMAPEVIDCKNKGYGLAADIWSLGCTVLEMLTRHVPYFPLEWQQAMYRSCKGEPPAIPEKLSKDARDFIKQCNRVNPNDRPTAAELLEHPFLHRPFYTALGSELP